MHNSPALSLSTGSYLLSKPALTYQSLRCENLFGVDVGMDITRPRARPLPVTCFNYALVYVQLCFTKVWGTKPTPTTTIWQCLMFSFRIYHKKCTFHMFFCPFLLILHRSTWTVNNSLSCVETIQRIRVP